MVSTRERIIKAGAQIIAHEGLRMFTAKRIGEKLGISDAAIFKHFPTMDSIAEEIISRYTTECLRRTDEAIRNGKNAVERLELILEGHIDYLEETRGISPVLCFEFSRSNRRKLKKLIFDFLNSYADKVGWVIQEGIKEGTIRRDIDIEEVSFSFIGLMQAKVFQWFIRGRKGRIVKDRESLKKMILNGLVTRQP
ncbi:TetR family transcriptional regulator [Hydrogenivirga caldilitoris]|uniref:TetR family transcriptional regulator n=1 Tax=Hydrogenivirga caldilitoris TaxID=246264 RepID=A0A497XSL4_9AQUI|nr:TetR/AcrR family transcriptional regulator [Hydrogenivirga caldilitoris]RLJ71294.1 TetR family transcriptional regulator [Hydrogenivirga caldilitoris]